MTFRQCECIKQFFCPWAEEINKVIGHFTTRTFAQSCNYPFVVAAQCIKSHRCRSRDLVNAINTCWLAWFFQTGKWWTEMHIRTFQTTMGWWNRRRLHQVRQEQESEATLDLKWLKLDIWLTFPIFTCKNRSVVYLALWKETVEGRLLALGLREGVVFIKRGGNLPGHYNETHLNWECSWGHLLSAV